MKEWSYLLNLYGHPHLKQDVDLYVKVR